MTRMKVTRMFRNLALAALAVSVLLSAALAAAAQDTQPCDRVCLSGFITTYLAALVAHDPSRLPVTPGVRFTENGVAVPLGEALWLTIGRLYDYRVDYLDTEAQQAASHVAFVENDRPGLMALRLKIVGGKIAEIETVLNRGAPRAASMPPVEALWTQVRTSCHTSYPGRARGGDRELPEGGFPQRRLAGEVQPAILPAPREWQRDGLRPQRRPRRCVATGDRS